MNKSVLSKHIYFKEDSNLHSVRSKEKEPQIQERKRKKYLAINESKELLYFPVCFQIKGKDGKRASNCSHSCLQSIMARQKKHN